MPATVADRRFTMTVACDHNRWQLRLAGPVDSASGADLLDMADVMATLRVPDTDIDLSEVSFINTAGLRAVEEACEQIERTGGSARTTHESEAVSRLRSHEPIREHDHPKPKGAA